MKERMLQRGLAPALLLAAVLVAGGCGGDDENPAGGALPTFDLKNGTWATTSTWWATGPDSCGELPPDSADTLVACSFDPVDIQDSGLPDNFQCNVTRDGDQVLMSCSGSVSQGCTYTLNMEGSGTILEDQVDFTLASVVRASGPEPCPGSVPACTLWVNLAGHWISSEGDSLCTETTQAAPAGLEQLVSGQGFGGFSQWSRP